MSGGSSFSQMCLAGRAAQDVEHPQSQRVSAGRAGEASAPPQEIFLFVFFFSLSSSFKV